MLTIKVMQRHQLEALLPYWHLAKALHSNILPSDQRALVTVGAWIPAKNVKVIDLVRFGMLAAT